MGGGAKKVGLEVDLGTGEAKRGLQELDAQIKSLEKQQEKATGSVWGRWANDAKRAILQTQRDASSAVDRLPSTLMKSGLNDLANEFAKRRDAIAAAGRTTFEGAAESARKWQASTQTATVAIGKDVHVVNRQVMAVAKATGEMPETTLGWSRSIRQLGTSWNDAVGGVEVFTDRALQTDRTLSQMLPVAESITDSFGIRKSSDVSQFFNTLDNNAKRAGMSVEQMERSVMALSGAFGALGKSNLSSVSAVFGALSQKAASPEQARNAMGALASMPSQYLYGFEKRARAMGLLKKGEYATDERGQARPELLLDFAEVMQKKLPGHLHAKDRMDLIAKMGRTMFGPGLEGRQIASSLLSLDVPALRTQSREVALQSVMQQRGAALQSYRQSGTYQYNRAAIEKDERDRVEVGNEMAQKRLEAMRGGGGLMGTELDDKTVSGAMTIGAYADQALNFARRKLGQREKTESEMMGYSNRSQVPEPWEGFGNAQSIRDAAKGSNVAVLGPDAASAFGKAVAQELNKASPAPALGSQLPTQSTLER